MKKYFTLSNKSSVTCRVIRTVFFAGLLFVIFPFKLRAQAPVISYSGGLHIYTADTAITPLAPTSARVGAFGYTEKDLGPGFDNLSHLAVNGAGDIYFTLKKELYRLPAGSGTPLSMGSGFNFINGIAVDKYGNVYVIDLSNTRDFNTVKKVPAAGGNPVIIATFNSVNGDVVDFVPTGIAADSIGNVYVCCYGTKQVEKIPANGGSPLIFNTGVSEQTGLTVDPYGNIYVVASQSTTQKIIPTDGSNPFNLYTIGSDSFLTPSAVYAAIAVDAWKDIIVSTLSKPIEIEQIFPKSAIYKCKNNKALAIDKDGTLYTVSNTQGYIAKLIRTGGYYISPALPQGLELDRNTGIISGMPVVSSPATTYTITAYNAKGKTSATVNISVDPSNSSQLSSLSLPGATLSSGFYSAGLKYTTKIADSIPTINIIPTAYIDSAKITVNGVPVSSGDSAGPLTVNIGINTFTIVVTAADNSSAHTYTLTVYKGSSSTLLSGLDIESSAGPSTLSPAFNTRVSSYNINFPDVPATIKITPTASSPGTHITVDGLTVASGTSASIHLNGGHSTINIGVTSPNTLYTGTYIITFYAGSSSALLSGLEASTGTLSPAFNPDSSLYSLGVPADTGSIRLTPVYPYPGSNIQVNNIQVASGASSQPISINEGVNTISVYVISPNTVNRKQYIVKVTRAFSQDALASLVLRKGTLSPAFSGSVTTYTASVPAYTRDDGIIASTAFPGATITINGIPRGSDKTNGPVPLAFGPNVFNIVVTSADGLSSKTYTLTLYKGGNLPVVDQVKITNSTGFLDYEAGVRRLKRIENLQFLLYDKTRKRFQTLDAFVTVGHNDSTISISTTVIRQGITLKIDGIVTPVNQSTPFNLNTGNNLISLTFISSDKRDSTTYLLLITRAPKSVYLYRLNFAYSTDIIYPSPSPADSSFNINLDYRAEKKDELKAFPVDPDAHIQTYKTVSDGPRNSKLYKLVVTTPGLDTSMTYYIHVYRKKKSGGSSVSKPLLTDSVAQPADSVAAQSQAAVAGDGIKVNPAVSPNGDGINDFLKIDGISAYPDNKVTILNSSGDLVTQISGYDNKTNVFNGRSAKGALQAPGTYYYILQYQVKGKVKTLSGYLVLQY